VNDLSWASWAIMPHPTWLAAFPEEDIILTHHLHIQEKEKIAQRESLSFRMK
jgi:hypothetical protein